VRGYDKDTIAIDWNGVLVHGVAPDYRPDAGQKVAASLRPENVKFSARKPAHGRAVKCRIVNRIFKGSRTALNVRLADSEATIIKAYTDIEMVDAIAGDQIWVHWDIDKMCVVRE